jgi:hypothetical protein
MTILDYHRLEGEPLHTIWKRPRGYEGYAMPNGEIHIWNPEKTRYLTYSNYR